MVSDRARRRIGDHLRRQALAAALLSWMSGPGPVTALAAAPVPAAALLPAASPDAGPTDYVQLNAVRESFRRAYDDQDYAAALDRLYDGLALQKRGERTRLWELYRIPFVLDWLHRPCHAAQLAEHYLQTAPVGEPALEKNRAEMRALGERAALACHQIAVGNSCERRPDALRCVCREQPDDPRCAPVIEQPFRGTLSTASGGHDGRRVLFRADVTVGYQWPHIRLEGGVGAVIEGLPAFLVNAGARVSVERAAAGGYARVATQYLFVSQDAGGLGTSLGGMLGLGWEWALSRGLGVFVELDGELWGTAEGDLKLPLLGRLGVSGAL